MDRRKFIKDLTAPGVAAGMERISRRVPYTWAAEPGQMACRHFGSTGEQALTALRTCRPLSPSKVAARLTKTAAAAARGRYELYKTSDHFDSRARNPQWLG